MVLLCFRILLSCSLFYLPPVICLISKLRSSVSPNCCLSSFLTSLILTPSHCPDTSFSFTTTGIWVSNISPSSPSLTIPFSYLPPSFNSCVYRKKSWMKRILVTHAINKHKMHGSVISNQTVNQIIFPYQKLEKVVHQSNVR